MSFLSSIFTRFEAPFYSLFLILKQSFIYISYPRLIVFDFLLFLYRLLRFTPRLFIQEAEDLTYGEVSYAALKQLLDTYALNATSFMDCGSGLGKGLGFVSAYRGIDCIGLEINPGYNRFFRKVCSFMRFSGVTVLDFDLRDGEYPSSDVVLLLGTCFDEFTIAKISESLVAQSPGVVFSVSQTLDLPGYTLIAKKRLPFSWWYAWVFVYKK